MKTKSTVNKHRILIISFKNTISHEEISMFRGAIISTIENANVLFHNHEHDKLRYNYPLIQYKRINQRAAIVCIDDGVDAIGNFFSNSIFDIQIGNNSVKLELDSVKAHQTVVKVCDDMFSYRISAWLPFNQENYSKYSNTESLADKYGILESILIGNILSFAKGIGIHLEQQIICKITKISEAYITEYKGVKMSEFNATFKSNISIPDFTGLGKGVSIGHGTVSQKRIINHRI